MGCCVQMPMDEDGAQLANELEMPKLIQEHPSSQSSSSNNSDSYKLNDLRSLEGIATLWSEKLNAQNPRNSGNRRGLSLQNTLSEQIRGNRTFHDESPIAISTYYFIHAPNAEDNPNLLQSHSAPAKVTKPNILAQQAHHDAFPRKISEDVMDEDVVVNMELPEYFGQNTLSPVSANKIQFPFHNNPSMVPVFSFSNSNGSMFNDSAVPQWGDGSSGFNGFHLNIGLEPIESPMAANSTKNTKITPVRHTYSNRNVFTMCDDMSSNDFMEY